MGSVLKWIFWGTIALIVWYAVADVGRVSLTFEQPKSARYRQTSHAIEESGVFQAAVADLDEHLVLPQDLTVEFAECGVVNAFYHPDRFTIRMCYELAERYAWAANRRYRADSVANAAVYQSLLFTFYHEVGHALVHVLALPITGREEDAVDQLAAWVLLEAGDDGRDAAVQGALTFLDGPFGRGASWDTHSFDRQRYYNLLCWVYGSDPSAHGALLRGGWRLPADRAKNCEYEYQQLRNAWSQLLAGRFI